MKYNNSIGVIRNLSIFFDEGDETIIERMAEEGIETVQVLCSDFNLMTPQNAEKLLKSGYKGDLYIERESRGEQQLIDILKTVHYVKRIMEET